MQRKKTVIITARMTPGIKDLIQHQARQGGMTVTDYIINGSARLKRRTSNGFMMLSSKSWPAAVFAVFAPRSMAS